MIGLELQSVTESVTGCRCSLYIENRQKNNASCSSTGNQEDWQQRSEQIIKHNRFVHEGANVGNRKKETFHNQRPNCFGDPPCHFCCGPQTHRNVCVKFTYCFSSSLNGVTPLPPTVNHCNGSEQNPPPAPACHSVTQIPPQK